ncbi:MAG: hypothetical protein ACR2QM_05515 [Longimicrobiales bacterium]
MNQPRPIQVQVGAGGVPVTILLRGKNCTVEAIREQWRIDDEWWRSPISRRYLQVVLTTGVLVTLFQDLVEEQWYLQDA